MKAVVHVRLRTAKGVAVVVMSTAKAAAAERDDHPRLGFCRENRTSAERQIVDTGVAFTDVGEFSRDPGMAVNPTRRSSDLHFRQQTVHSFAKFDQAFWLIELAEARQ